MATKLQSLTDKVEFRRGYNAESVLADCLRDDGYFVHITADLEERGHRGAPGARSGNNFITLPDLDVASKGHRAFVEVKYKSEASFTIKTGRYEHGFGLRKYRMYCQAQQTYGTPVYIAVIEGKTGAVLMATLDELGVPRIYDGNKMDAGGMAFFPRGAFGLWGYVRTYTGQLPLGIPLDKGDGDLFKVARH